MVKMRPGEQESWRETQIFNNLCVRVQELFADCFLLYVLCDRIQL